MCIARVFILQSDFLLLHLGFPHSDFLLLHLSFGRVLHHTCQSSTAQPFSSTLMGGCSIPRALFPGYGGDGPQKTASIRKKVWRLRMGAGRVNVGSGLPLRRPSELHAEEAG